MYKLSMYKVKINSFVKRMKYPSFRAVLKPVVVYFSVVHWLARCQSCVLANQ